MNMEMTAASILYPHQRILSTAKECGGVQQSADIVGASRKFGTIIVQFISATHMTLFLLFGFNLFI